MFKPVLCFWSPYQDKEVEPGAAVLSNWHPSPTKGTYGKTSYKFATSEHHYMAIKALAFGDKQSFNSIRISTDPKEAKKLGGAVANFDEAIWSSIRKEAMMEACRAKLMNHDAWRLRSYLLGTYPRILAEASPYDLIWGIGLDRNDPLCQDVTKWRGQNLLGQVLMELRAELRAKEYNA